MSTLFFIWIYGGFFPKKQFEYGWKCSVLIKRVSCGMDTKMEA